MANLGNLWFSVGLKDQTDADWEKIVNRVEKRGAKLGLQVDAQKLQSEINAAIANKKYTIDLSVAVKDNQVEAAIRNAYNRMAGIGGVTTQTKPSTEAALIRADAYSKAQAQLERSRKALAELREARLKDAEAARQQRAANDDLSRTMVKTNSISSQLRNEILNVYSVYTIQNFLRSVIEIGGEFEKQRLALGSILQDAGHATELFSQIKNLAVISPFGIRELTNYAKQLAAFNIPYNELYDTTKRLADISAGVGVDMSRIILAYGQVRSAEFLKGTELRQFTEAGIPLVQALADYFTKLEGTAVSVGDVFDKISKRQVSFDDVRKVLWAMTDEGGLFNNMQEVLSESLSGKWSNLKDAYDIMLADIAESNNAIAKGVIEGLTELMNNWEALVPVVFSAIGALGYYKAAMISNNILHGKENLELTRNALLLKQKQADVLRIAKSYRTLTAAEQGLLASSGKLSTAEYRQLAVSGQLTKEYALRLMALGRLKSGQAGHLAQVLQISKAEMAAALSASKWRVAMAGLAVSVRGLGVALKSLLFNPFTLVFAGLTVVMELYNSWQQKNDEMEQNVRDLAQKATEGYKRVHEQLKGFEGIDLGKVKGDSLVTSIEQIEETLKNYSPRYNDIQKEADEVSELTNRYRILLDALRETEEAYKTLEEIKDVSEAANAATDGWLDESLRENAQDYSEALQSARKELRDLSQYSISISEAIQEAAKADGGFAKAIEGKTLNEQIALLYNYGKAYQHVLTSFSGKAERVALMDYFDAIREAASVFEKEVVPDAERYAKYMRQSLEGEGWDFSKLTKAQEDALRMSVQDFVTKIPDITEEARKKIEDEILTVRFQLAPVIEDYQAEPILGTYAKLIENVSDNGLFTEKELSSVNDAASAYKLVSGRLKEAEENLASLNRVKADAMTPEQRSIYTSQLEAAEKEADGYRKVREALFTEEQKEQKTTGSGKDSVAERWKERLGLMKDAESEYRKWSELVGKDAAVEKLRGSGLFGELGEDFDFADARKEMERFLQEIEAAASTDKQRDVARELAKQLFDFSSDDVKRQVDAQLKALERYISGTAREWDLFKKAKDATGNREFAMNLAFGGTVSYGNFLEQLRADIEEELAGSGFSLDEVVSMDSDALKREGLQGLEPLVDAYRAEGDKLREETADMLIGLVGEYKDYAAQVADIERRLQEDIAKIEGQRTVLGDERTDRLIAQRKKSAEEEKGGVMWERFKDENDWAQVFDDLDRVGTATLRSLTDGLEGVAKSADLSVEDTKELVEAMRKLREESIERNPLQGFRDAARDVKKWKFALDMLGDLDEYTFKREEGGFRKGETVTRLQADSGLRSAYNDEVQAIDEVCRKFDSLASGIDMVSELFEALGGGDVLGSIGDALSGGLKGASQMSGIASSLFGSAAGPIGAAVGGAMGLVTSLFTGLARRHDEALQEEIEASQLRVKQSQSLYDSLERTLERTLGTGRNIKDSAAEQEKRILEMGGLDRSFSTINHFGKDLPFMANLGKVGDYNKILRERVSAYDEGGTYGYQRQLLEEQYAELESQIAAEKDKKDTDYNKVQDYRDQMAELRDQITYMAEDVAKELYSIDLKDWAQQLGDTLYDAWMRGEDGADAFRQKAGDIIGQVMNDILRLQILEPAMKGISDYLFGTDEERSANGGKGGVFGTDFELDEEEMKGLADRLMGMADVSGEYTDLMEQLNEYLKEAGVDLKDLGDDASDGLSAGIESITEDTAGTLASYLNAIRQDVSVERGLIERFVGDDFPQVSAMVQAQLAQLEMIARNTGANAESAAGILELLRRNVNGGNKFHFS